MNKIKIFVPALSFLFVFAACNQAEKQEQETTQSDSINVSKPVEIELSDANIDLAYDQYLKLKDVLVLSDSLQTQMIGGIQYTHGSAALAKDAMST
jgi:hypothetical protein